MDGQLFLNGKKNDNGKPRLDLLSKVFMWGIAQVMTDGAIKYGDNNWRGGMKWSRPYAALQRHLTAWWDGEDTDPESGRSHLYHAGAELMFLAEYMEKNNGRDDRYKAQNEASHDSSVSH